MSEFQASNFKKAQGGGASDIVGKVEFTSPYFFVPPSGNTASRPESCAPGTIRFNTDVGTLEVYRGDTIGWEFIQRRDGQYLGGGTGSNVGTGARGVFGNRAEPSITDELDYITISTLGNAQLFGESTDARYTYSTCSSSTRGFMAGGLPSVTDTIDFVTFSSTADATDFGNLTQARWLMMDGCSSSTRGLFAGGLHPSPSTTFDIIDYITMASAGNAVDFGNLTQSRRYGEACSSSTRGIFAGGYNPDTNIIEFVTIATLGNGTDFGDMLYNGRDGGAASNATRGIIFGGGNPAVNTISFITIATLGNALDFGDLDNLKANGGACSSPTRAVYGGGLNPGNKNNIEYIEIPTTGNALDFGDLVAAGHNLRAFSNGHGGL